MVQTAEGELVDRFEEFYRDQYDEEIAELAEEYPSKKRSLYIGWEDLSKFDSDIAYDYLKKPEQLREYAEEALRLYDLPRDVSLGQAHVRITNLPDQVRLSEIRSPDLNTLISVYATVDSTSTIESKLEEAAFECQRCGTLSYIPQSGGFQEPHECQGCERQGPFSVNNDQSTFVDSQTIRLQERLTGVGTDEDIETIVVHLRDDIVDSVGPGDHVNITGVLRREEHDKLNSGTISDKYIDAVSVELAGPYDHISLDEEDKRAIVGMAGSRDVIEKITDSIAPSVHGLSDLKLAIALQLFSGVPKELPDDTQIRGDIHILVVGDPGTAKSVLLDRAAQLAPRAVKTSGKETTAVGLTAAATPSANSTNADPWSIEGGALVLANHGLASIDDFTNLPQDAFQSLHGVLEEQEIDLSKATRTRTLPAITSVLAAGTPKYGRFDEYEPIIEQINVEPGLLSQFDLLFTVSDQPNEEDDRELAEHVLDTNYLGELNAQYKKIQGENKPSNIEGYQAKFRPDIETNLLRKYIAYARRDCHPSLSEEAQEVIKEFYVNIRSDRDEEGQPVPVTVRKLEGVVRLAEASARMRLSDTVEESDAKRVVELVQASLRDLGISTQEDNNDISDMSAGSIDEKMEMDVKIKAIIEELVEEHEYGAPIDKVFQEVSRQLGLDESKVEHEIEKLKQKGEAYEPRQGVIRLA